MARRRLDVELVGRKMMASRSAAREAIDAGNVEVRGVAKPKPATLVTSDVSIRIRRDKDYVGRGGYKLKGALDDFGLKVKGSWALDIGSSTGGFTDCLLQHGAVGVVALDVGYGQLDWMLRTDSRVNVIERTNFRYAIPEELGAPFDLIVADLSFISLVTVVYQLRAMGNKSTDYILLVKPQFEVGRDEVGNGGIVRDPVLHATAVEKVATALEEQGIGLTRAVPSALRGAKGNIEFFVWGRSGERTFMKQDIDAMVMN